MNKKSMVITAIAAILGGGIYFGNSLTPAPSTSPSKTPVEPAPIQGAGIIDFKVIEAKHPDNARLKELRGRERRLKMELDELMRPVKSVQPPEADEKPFKDSVWQKNAQTVITEFSEVRRRKLKAAEDYREGTRDDYIQRRNAVRDVYLNRALNITLKLQNADTLKLTPEQIQALKDELDKVVFERNQKQLELLNEWTAEIDNYAEKAVADDVARLRKEAREAMENEKISAVQNFEEAQRRNEELTKAKIAEMESRQRRRKEVLAELAATVKELSAVEQKIFDSIVDETAKLGAIYRLECILTKTDFEVPENYLPAGGGEMTFELKAKNKIGAPIVAGKDAKDLTGELLKEFERQAELNKTKKVSAKESE